jgi:transposase-like protein
LRDLEELMAERSLTVDHSTVGHQVLRLAVDETCVRAAGFWAYQYRAVDSSGT